MFEIRMRLILVQLALVIGNAVGDAQTPPRTCSYSSPPLELPAPVAVIRYRSQLEIVVQGRHIPRQGYGHTDLYERHGAQ